MRFRLPRVVAHFTGRDTELARLEEALGERHQAVITQTVTGLGGVGKTQLAAAYAHRHVDEYEVVAWVRAEDGGIADLAALAGHLTLPVEGLTPEEQGQRVVRWLESTERSWLLVLDNVATPAHLAALCPSSGPGRVLVTSRRRDFDQFGPVVAVGVFDELTAVGYLMDRTGRSGERAAAGRLAQAVGYLPLALSHAAAYCTTRTNFEGYLALLAGLPA
ncbi:MAG TPA: NB-ARC domain-containing protein, partial [Candidatus Dormibacteraeota bacterium]|nr:NB-ARC domain-containing protein [Candidatus Dormibacteraeota bacterium]